MKERSSPLSGATAPLAASSPHWLASPLFSLCIVIALALATRLFNLDAIDLFSDEKFHIGHAMRAHFLNDIAHGFKVFGYLLFYPTARWGDDSLMATRLLVALLGVATTAIVFLTTHRLAGLMAARIAGVAWGVMPYIVFHDRLALHDPIISLLTALFLFCIVTAHARNRPFLYAPAGLFLGLAAITKVTALSALCLFGFAYALLPPNAPRFKTMALLTMALFFPLALLLPAFLQTFDSFLGIFQSFTGYSEVSGQGNLASVLTPLYAQFIRNAARLQLWVVSFNGVSFLALSLMALLYPFVRRSRPLAALSIGTALSVAAFMIVFHGWFSRYLLASFLPLVMLIGVMVADAITTVRRKRNRRASQVVALLTLPLALWMAGDWLQKSFAFTTGIAAAEGLPPDDRLQYFDNPASSAQGLGAIRNFLEEYATAHPQKIVVIKAHRTRDFAWFGLDLLPTMLRGTGNLSFRRVAWEEKHREALVMREIIFTQGSRTLLLLPREVRARLFSAFSFAPSPSLLFSRGDYEIYAMSAATEWKTANGGSTIVTALSSSRGVEWWDGEESLWLGSQGGVIKTLATKGGCAALRLHFVAAPDLSGRSIKRLRIETGAGYGEEVLAPETGTSRIIFPVQPGENSLRLTPLDEPNSTTINIGGAGPMLVGLQKVAMEPYAGPCATVGQTSVQSMSPSGGVIYGGQGAPLPAVGTSEGEIEYRSLTLNEKEAAIELVRASLTGSTIYLADEEPYQDYAATIASLITPPAQKRGRENLYAVPQGELWIKGVPDLLITAIDNRNGLERWEGKSGLWLDESETVVTALARKKMEVVIEGAITPGPSVATEGERRLIVQVNGQAVADSPFTQKRQISLRAWLRKGENKITLSATAQNVHPASTSDKRRLIAGVRGLVVRKKEAP